MRARNVKWMWTCSILLICLSMALIPDSANALPFAAGTSTAEIKWNTLDIVEDGLEIIYHPDTYVSRSKAKVWSRNPSAYIRDRERVSSWSDTQANRDIPGATAAAYTSDAELYESVSATVDGADSQRWAQARADRWVYFEVKGSGSITLTADYTMYQQIDLDTENDWIYADSEVWLELYNKNTDETLWDWRWIERELWGAADETNEETGTLEISLDYSDGDYGYMWMGVYNEVWAYNGAPSPVPEPATMILLGSGLVCLAGFRRKFRSN